jgi:hypothetical protein
MFVLLSACNDTTRAYSHYRIFYFHQRLRDDVAVRERASVARD